MLIMLNTALHIIFIQGGAMERLGETLNSDLVSEIHSLDRAELIVKLQEMAKSLEVGPQLTAVQDALVEALMEER
jgi:hypothetical protein